MTQTKKIQLQKKIREIRIVHQDPDIMVVYKPPGILMQADSTGDLDLLTWCRRVIRRDSRGNDRPFVGMVQRLDRPVAGIVVVAKSPEAASALNMLMSEHLIIKSYYAIVHGHPPDEEHLKDKLLKDTRNRTSHIVDPETDGRSAALSYHVVERRQSRALLHINLETGRHHQIRVQLSHRGYPIVADRKYGSREVLRDPGMIALWAYRLEFPHPVSQQMMDVRSPKPVHWPWYQQKTAFIEKKNPRYTRRTR